MAQELLKSIIPQRLEIGSGFIITAKGNVSTQCDLVIYDKNNCPLIENNNKQRFFPIECVVAIGEIKSDLNKDDLKKALIKLKKNKLLRNDIPSNNSYIYKDFDSINFNPKENIYDEIMTFLICNKFNFNYANIVNEMDDIYEDKEYYLRHNMILSIENGTLMYMGFPNNNQFCLYPNVYKQILLNVFIKPFDEKNKTITINNSDIVAKKYEHIITFLNYMYMGTSVTSIMYPEMTNYLSKIRLNEQIIEKK